MHGDIQTCSYYCKWFSQSAYWLGFPCFPPAIKRYCCAKTLKQKRLLLSFSSRTTLMIIELCSWKTVCLPGIFFASSEGCYIPSKLSIEKHCENKIQSQMCLRGRRGGLMVSELDSGSSGPGSSPNRGLLGKTLNSHSASLHPGV